MRGWGTASDLACFKFLLSVWKTGGRREDELGGIKGSRPGGLRVSAGWVAAVGTGSQARWSPEGRVDKLGGTFDLMPHFKSTVFFKMFKNGLSPITLLYANYGKI